MGVVRTGSKRGRRGTARRGRASAPGGAASGSSSGRGPRGSRPGTRRGSPTSFDARGAPCSFAGPDRGEALDVLGARMPASTARLMSAAVASRWRSTKESSRRLAARRPDDRAGSPPGGPAHRRCGRARRRRRRPRGTRRGRTSRAPPPRRRSSGTVGTDPRDGDAAQGPRRRLSGARRGSTRRRRAGGRRRHAIVQHAPVTWGSPRPRGPDRRGRVHARGDLEPRSPATTNAQSFVVKTTTAGAPARRRSAGDRPGRSPRA